MGTVSIQKFDNGSCLGLWEITESLDELYQCLELTSYDQAILEKKTNERNKKEWLACRNLLKAMSTDHIEIRYDPNGKPFDLNHRYHVSMSHSGDYASAYLSTSGPVGTDIQKIKPSLKAGADFFLNEEELPWADIENNLLMHLIWSAKETTFKFMGESKLDFKKDIVINRFDSNQNDAIEVNVSNRQTISKIMINYYFVDDYIFTWTV